MTASSRPWLPMEGRILLYRGGAQPNLVADLEVESVGEDLFDNGAASGTWLPAVVITTREDGKPLGFFPREAGLIPDAGKVRAIAATLRGNLEKSPPSESHRARVMEHATFVDVLESGAIQ